jgi:hypothetical protein
MSLHCALCNRSFEPHQYNQRFCTPACSSDFYAAERRLAVELLRRQGGGMTYHSLAQLDDDSPGGRLGLPTSQRVVTSGPPMSRLPVAAWSRDPVPTEPLIQGDSDVFSIAVGGEGGQRQ